MSSAGANDPLRLTLEAALGTHYEVRRELGRGGMGAVFLAHEKGLDRDVAIKVLKPDHAETPEHRERFRLEARAAARLSHANIVPLHTFGDHEGMLYYVMGYVEGQSLADRLAREGHLGEEEARRILAALAGALHYAHARGILHRDVKPQNILIEAGSNRPLLVDFGISKMTADASGHTAVGTIVGTPDYMSPEQASSNPDLDGRSDLYSLGLVGYAMLSGHLPFKGRTPGEIMTRRLMEPAPRLTCADQTVSDDLVSAIMRCLERDAGARWADCDTFGRYVALEGDDEDDGELFSGAGNRAIIFAYAGVVSYVIPRASSSASVPLEVLGVVVPTMAFLLVVFAVHGAVDLRRRGYLGRAIARVLFREPANWITWYPPALRRRGNVWHRLPVDLRALRTVMGLLFVSVVLLIGPMLFAFIEWPRRPFDRGLVRAAVIPVVLLFSATLLGSSLVSKRLQRAGLSEQEADSVAFKIPLFRRFWQKPSIAALLTGPASSPRPSTDDAETRTRVD